MLVWYHLLFKSIQICYKRNKWRISQKLGLTKVFLQVKRLGNAFPRTCLNLKHTEEKYDNIRKHLGNGHSVPWPSPHCKQMSNSLFKNLQIGMKIPIWIAKWFLTIQIRTIPYYWKSWLQYLLCPRIFRTTHVYIYIYSKSMKTQHLYFQYLSKVDLSINILLSSDNCTLHILLNDQSLYWLVVNMHCLKVLVTKQVIWLPVMLRMGDLNFCILLF